MKNEHKNLLKGVNIMHLSRDTGVDPYTIYKMLVTGLDITTPKIIPIPASARGLFKKRLTQVAEAREKGASMTIILKRILRLAQTVRNIKEAEILYGEYGGLLVDDAGPDEQAGFKELGFKATYVRERTQRTEKLTDYIYDVSCRLAKIVTHNIVYSTQNTGALNTLASCIPYIEKKGNTETRDKFPYLRAFFKPNYYGNILILHNLFTVLSKKALLGLVRRKAKKQVDGEYNYRFIDLAVAMLVKRFYFVQPIEQTKRETGIQTELLFEEEPALV